MPAEVIDQPNPSPLPSGLPEEIEKLAVQLQCTPLDPKDHDDLAKFRRAACFIAAGTYHIYSFQNCAEPLGRTDDKFLSHDLSPG